MNIYKTPNLISSPKRKVYRRGGGGVGAAGALNYESIYTHTYTLYMISYLHESVAAEQQSSAKTAEATVISPTINIAVIKDR